MSATFWLLQAPDSLAQQSRREPDGTGLGTFDSDGRPVVSKQPLAAFQDQQFGREAREVSSRTFVAHVRYASNGGETMPNTHPFEQQGRLFAHNGVIGGLPALERELGSAMSMVGGETDSERFFALITREIEACGDVDAGIERAASWVARNLPVLSLNFVLVTADGLWALRYPATHELHLLARDAGGPTGDRHLEHAGTRVPGRIRVHSAELAKRPAVIVATEPMDQDAGWRELVSGELLHVDGRLRVSSRRALRFAAAHPLTLADLDPRAAASQVAGRR